MNSSSSSLDVWGFYPTTNFRKFHVPSIHSSHTNSVSIYPPTTCEITKSCRRIFQIGWIQDPLLKSVTRSSLNSRSRSSSEIVFKILITRQDPHQGIHKDPCQDSRKGLRPGPLLAQVPCSPGPLKDRDPCPDPCGTPPLGSRSSSGTPFGTLLRNRVQDPHHSSGSSPLALILLKILAARPGSHRTPLLGPRSRPSSLIRSPVKDPVRVLVKTPTTRPAKDQDPHWILIARPDPHLSSRSLLPTWIPAAHPDPRQDPRLSPGSLVLARIPSSSTNPLLRPCPVRSRSQI